MTCIRRPNSTWTTCPCPACRKDAARMAKLARNGRYTRVPSEAAEAVIARLEERGWTDHAIASATGLHHRTIGGARYRGGKFAPVTAARIVNHGDPTAGSVGALGSQRRLRGLARQGYDLQTIADATGIGFSTLAAIRNRDAGHVRASFYVILRDYTEAVGMTVGPSSLTIKHAERNDWPGLLAWEDIDDPAERARWVLREGRSRDSIDEAVVLRLLEGERVHATRAERDEAMRRWKAAGKHEAHLCRMHGWKDSRYGRAVA